MVLVKHNELRSKTLTYKKPHLNDNDGLLQHIVDLGLDQLEKNIDATLGGALQLDGAAADSPYGLPNEFHVHLLRVLF